MKTQRMMIALLVAAVVAFGGLGAATANHLMKGRPTAIAVCDVQRLFDSLKEKAQVEGDLQVQAQKLQQEKTDREKDLRQLQSDLEILAPDTPAYDQKQDELERKAVELQAWAQFQQNKLNRERAVQIEGIYRKMADAIGRVAKENGYDVVLFKEAEINFRGAKPEQLSGLIQIRKVLFAVDDLDVTDVTVSKMNNEFVNRAP